MPPIASELPPNNPGFFCPESSKVNHIAPDELVEKLLKYDVISFDIFDTLILRPFANPYALFLLLSSKYKEANFQNIRIISEKNARMKALEQRGNEEINIYDIYRELTNYINVDPKQGAELEIETEMDVCQANPYVKLVYDMLLEQRKEIIAVSDMYIPKSWMKKILHKCGYDHFSDIYISCDYGESKRNSKLFTRVQMKRGSEKLYIHIGDNARTDVTGAKKAGWESFHLPSVHFLGQMYRPAQTNDKRLGLSPLVGAAYNGIVNCHLHNGLRKENDYYEYGFKCGGPFAIGFCTWIHDKCIKENIEKVLFTSRDGYALKLIYDRLFNDIPSEYVLWSRSLAARVSAKYFPYYFKNLLLYERRGCYFQSKVIDELKYFKIAHLEPKLSKYELNANDYVGSRYMTQYERLVRFIEDHMEDVIHAFNMEESALKKYYKNIIGNCKKIACVDIGWSGMNINAFKIAVETDWSKECNVVGLLAGMIPQTTKTNSAQLSIMDQDVYLFSSIINTEQMEFLRNKANAYPFFYEIFSGAPHSTIYRVEQNEKNEYEFTFNIPDVDNYWVANEIRRGMIEFAEIYLDQFKKYSFMLRIPGNDVASIVRHELSRETYIRDIFGELPYQFSRLMPSYERYVGKVKMFLK